MEKIPCPHCDAELLFPQPMTYNVRNYGGGKYDVKCQSCQKMVKTICQRVTKIDIQVFKHEEHDAEPSWPVAEVNHTTLTPDGY